MKCQMIRVISSPSSSTTGFSTLIFAMIRALVLVGAPGRARRAEARDSCRPATARGRYSTGPGGAEAARSGPGFGTAGSGGCALVPHAAAKGALHAGVYVRRGRPRRAGVRGAAPDDAAEIPDRAVRRPPGDARGLARARRL